MCVCVCVYVYVYTGLFISPSGISELDCTTTKKDTAERSISIGTESSFRSAQAATLLEFHVPFTNCFVCRWFCLVHYPKPPLHSHTWLSFGKFQDTECFLIHCERHFSSRLPPSDGTWKYAKAPSTKKLGEILYLLMCSFLLCLSWLLRSRVRKSRKDLWITLYTYDFLVQTHLNEVAFSVVYNMQHFWSSEEHMVKTCKFLFWVSANFWTSLNLLKTVNSHSLCCSHAWRWTAFWSSQAFRQVWALCGAVPEPSV